MFVVEGGNLEVGQDRMILTVHVATSGDEIAIGGYGVRCRFDLACGVLSWFEGLN